ncbi:MAG: hypothetical protein SPK32_00530, partial [Bacteroidaceae bacterium]|nr:hypothetical protein [Bacteroidaceae bacterium]
IPKLMTSYSENILPEYKSINALFPSEPAEVGSACSARKIIPAEVRARCRDLLKHPPDAHLLKFMKQRRARDPGERFA